MAAVTFIGGIATGFGLSSLLELLGGVKKAIIDEPSEAGARIGKIKIAEKMFHIRDIFASTFDLTCDTKPSLTIGIAPDGMVDIFIGMIETTVWLSALIGEQMSEELFLELLQEGISNAIQTSIGGTFQTMYNTFRGSQPSYGDDITSVVQIKDFLDPKIVYFIVANAGMNIFSTLHYLMQGMISGLNQAYSNLYNQLQHFATRLIEEDMYLHVIKIEYARNYLLADLQNTVNAADSLLRYAYEVIDTALARLNDMLNQLKTLRNDTEADITPPDKAYAIAEAVERSYQATREDTDKVYNSVIETINSLSAEIPEDALKAYEEAIEDYRKVIEKMVDAVNQEFYGEVSEVIDEVLDIMDALLAYRFYTDYERDLGTLPEEKFFEKYVPETLLVRVRVVEAGTA